MHPRFFRLINSIQSWDILPVAARRILLRIAGVRIAGRPNILSGCDFSQGPIYIGEGVFINRGCLIDGTGGVFIGAQAFIGYRASLITITHEIGPSSNRALCPRTEKGIRIGAGSWIGASVSVLPGVEIGAGSVVGAGTVVTRDILPDSLAVGVPARVIKKLP